MSIAAADTRPVRLNIAQRLAPPAERPLLQLRSTQDDKKKILFVTSELTDLVKTGGLADVSAALPRALGDRHDVRVLIPGYTQVMQCGEPIRIVGSVTPRADLPPSRIGRLDMPDGLIIYVVVCPDLYERDGLPYGDEHGQDWPDNPLRFARLCMAATDIADGTAGIRWTPDLVHAHDWPTGLTPAYMHWRGLTTPSVFTIHNLAYQGNIDMSLRRSLAIPLEGCGPERMEFYGSLSLLKAGIAYANQVTTVSATYAREITTPEFGCGMEGFLSMKARQGLLTGLLNGIEESWEPRSCSHLVSPLGPNDWSGKQANAAHVRKLFALDEGNGPLFCVVSRLVHQKGIDLTIEVATAIVEHGGQLAILGRGDPHIEDQVRRLVERFPGRVGARIGFNETDARRLFAGSDFLLMPSRYEPCGLSQMYAQRFASLPIAHRTGGLADSIDDGVTGFLFSEATVDSYRGAVERALAVHQNTQLLNAMRCRAMSGGFFWSHAIEPYDQLYQRLLGGRREVSATI
ncbi:glycogen synthase GlgA [Stutzerimonas stutzeri]|uniref:glycogen synthase GlgA n=1 Tax=Stutzerimonas stutzeri TaxID=316 RepID=UPI0021092FCB|nr:glycogen synthase GlgA [Stutzerimonas stutzeri]MCQ4318945.1 glycogen synthase GlgA [Stutzerimonas stutzeri]